MRHSTTLLIWCIYLLLSSASQFGLSAATSVRPMSSVLRPPADRTSASSPPSKAEESPSSSPDSSSLTDEAIEGQDMGRGKEQLGSKVQESVGTGPRIYSRGMDAAHYSIDKALNYALQVANSSILELNKPFVPLERFARYMEQLVENSTAVLRESIAASSAVYNISIGTVTRTANPAVLRVCEKELAGRIYARMVPLYKRQVSLLKQEVTVAFNKLVTEDIPVSVYILEDLQDAMRDTLRNFSLCAGRLTPRGAPVSRWNADFEVYELSQVMLEYIEGREHLYRAMGVLPRYGGSSGASPNALRVGNFALELPPTEVSVHVLAAHPLGRDYRQDPLTVRGTDKLSLSETADTVPKPTPAAEVRSAWKRRVEQQEASARTGSLPGRISSALRRVGTHLPSPLQRAMRRSEFAREMMMLPLSLKNPDISVASGGGQAQRASARRGGRGKARADAGEGADKEKEGLYESPLQRRLKRGPERFVRWDMSPLREARQELDELATGQAMSTAVIDSVQSGAGVSEVTKKLADQLLNLVPPLGKAYYATPQVDYGPAYSPSTVASSK